MTNPDELSENLISLYKIHIPVYLENLHKAFKQGDFDSLEDIAHNLSSSMGTIGDTKSCELLRNIASGKLTTFELSKTMENVSKRITLSVESL